MDAKGMFQKELFKLIDRKLTRSEILDALLTHSHFDQRTLAGILHDILLDAKRRDEDAKRREEDSELDFIDEWIDSKRTLKEKAQAAKVSHYKRLSPHPEHFDDELAKERDVEHAIGIASLKDFEKAIGTGKVPDTSTLASIARMNKSGLNALLYAYAEIIDFRSTGEYKDERLMWTCLEDAARKGSRQALYWLGNSVKPDDCRDLFYSKAMYSAFIRFRGVDQWASDTIEILEKILPTSEEYAKRCSTYRFASGWEDVLENELSAKAAELGVFEGGTAMEKIGSPISLLVEIPSPKSFDRDFYIEGSEATYPTLSLDTHSYLANVRTQCKFIARHLETITNESGDIQGDTDSALTVSAYDESEELLVHKFINQDTLIDIIRNLSNEEAWSLFANRDRPCKKRYLKLFRPLISYLFYLRCIQWIRGEETYGHLLDLQPKFRFDFHDFELNEIVHGTLDLEAFLSRCLDYFPNPLQEDFFSVFDYVRSNSNCHPTTVLKFQALTQAVGLDGPCYSQNMFIPIGCSFSCQE